MSLQMPDPSAGEAERRSKDQRELRLLSTLCEAAYSSVPPSLPPSLGPRARDRMRTALMGTVELPNRGEFRLSRAVLYALADSLGLDTRRLARELAEDPEVVDELASAGREFLGRSVLVLLRIAPHAAEPAVSRAAGRMVTSILDALLRVYDAVSPGSGSGVGLVTALTRPSRRIFPTLDPDEAERFARELLEFVSGQEPGANGEHSGPQAPRPRSRRRRLGQIVRRLQEARSILESEI